jgi:hypothetical protein
MAALREMARGVSGNDITSTIDRVRVRMTRLIHASRDRPAGGPANLRPADEPAVVASGGAGSALSPLAADISALQEILDDSEKLIREAWNVAAELNQVRRHCSHCESVGVLVEALGTFQGLLNRCRHNLRSAAKSVDNLRAAVSAGRK